MPLAILPLLSFGLTALTLYALLRTGGAWHLAVDRPNHRSLHQRPTPRIGGLVLVPAFLLSWILAPMASPGLVMLIAVLCLLSFADDRSHLPVALRLVAHASVAVGFCWFVARPPTWPWLFVAVAAIVVFTNFYNFMDGADGLAGGMAVLGFSAYAWAAAPADAGLAVGSACVAAATAGFLLFNFPPAQVFMGDAGSISLGFAAAALGLLGIQDGLWPAWFPLLVFSPFCVDAGVTLARRISRGERFWQGHRQHYYQRLIRMGWSHRRTVLNAYALMALAALSAVVGLALSPPAQGYLLAGWCLAYVVLLGAIDKRWRASPASADA